MNNYNNAGNKAMVLGMILTLLFIVIAVSALLYMVLIIAKSIFATFLVLLAAAIFTCIITSIIQKELAWRKVRKP